MSPSPRNFRKAVQPIVVPRLSTTVTNLTKEKLREKNQRVALTPNIRQFLKERPCILVTELNVNKHKEVKSKPLVNGMKVRLPVSKMSIVNGLAPPDKKTIAPEPSDIRGDESKKVSLFSCQEYSFCQQ